MTLEEVQKAGYGVSVTPTRLVLRSPKNKPETFTDDVTDDFTQLYSKVLTDFRYC